MVPEVSARAADTALRVVLAQINLRVGDIDGNCAQVIAAATAARDQQQADLILFPELTLTGYPPEDLLLRPDLALRVVHALEQIRQQCHGIALLVGYPASSRAGRHNAAALIADGQIQTLYYKQHLPNYSVFDEKRYFHPGHAPAVATVAGVRVGITICEDIWSPDPVAQATAAGAELILNINASPFHLNKGQEREAVLQQRSREIARPILYVNLVGGQDELVFDGGSLVVNATGEITQRADAFIESQLIVDLQRHEGAIVPIPQPVAPPLTAEASAWHALVLGVRDYVRKNGFPGVVIGLSGGIDSALTLAIAVDALGADQVLGVAMPSRYTAAMSVEDAEQEAKQLGVAFELIPIEPLFQGFLSALAPSFAGRAADVTEENLQARCRGVLLMALANKLGRMVLTTGNKSELAVGYATLYGDMAGGFDVLGDVPKTLVYRLAAWRNQQPPQPVIPQRVITRPPSAELAPDQCDSDSLPPYDRLDPILERYVEQDQDAETIIAAGFPPAEVYRVLRLVDLNEYKRRQAAPAVRITRRAFGRDRRYPITSGYRRYHQSQ